MHAAYVKSRVSSTAEILRVDVEGVARVKRHEIYTCTHAVYSLMGPFEALSLTKRVQMEMNYIGRLSHDTILIQSTRRRFLRRSELLRDEQFQEFIKKNITHNTNVIMRGFVKGMHIGISNGSKKNIYCIANHHHFQRETSFFIHSPSIKFE